MPTIAKKLQGCYQLQNLYCPKKKKPLVKRDLFFMFVFTTLLGHLDSLPITSLLKCFREDVPTVRLHVGSMSKIKIFIYI